MLEERKRRARERSAKWRAENPERARAAVRAWHEAHPEYKRENAAKRRKQDPALKRRQHLKDRYGITPEDYDRMFSEQAGKCAICGGTESKARSEHFHVDHCHKTGKVRSLLCGTCNTRFGWYEAHQDEIEAYYERHA